MPTRALRLFSFETSGSVDSARVPGFTAADGGVDVDTGLSLAAEPYYYTKSRLMLQRLLWLPPAVVFAGGAAILADSEPWLIGAALAIGGLAGVRPAACLVVMAAIAPLGGGVSAVFGLPTAWTEVALMAALGGWALARAWGPRTSTDRPFAATGAFMIVVAAASAVSLTGIAQLSWQPPAADPAAWARWLADDLRTPHAATRQASRLITGVMLAIAAREIARDQKLIQPVLAALVSAAAAIGAWSWVRLIELAQRAPDPLGRALEVMARVRISPLIPDANATGALMLLATPLTIGLFHTRWRTLSTASLVVLLGGNWLAGSRTTLLLTPVVLIAFAVLRARDMATRRLIGATGIAVALVLVGVAVSSGGRRYGQVEGAWTVRRDFVVVTGAMLAESPLNGVGIGQYRRRSSEFMPPSLRGQYAAENAHNQVLQVLGELGLTGAAGFLLFVGLGVRCAFARGTYERSEHAGLALGVCGSLLCWSAQHPLLVFDVAAPFWIGLGLLRSLCQGGVAAGRHWSLAAALLALTVVVSLPLRIRDGVGRTDMTGRTAGFSSRVDDPGGAFRETQAGGTLFLDGGATRCVVPLRARGVQDSALVTLRLGNQDAGTVRVGRGVWLDVPLVLPAHPHPPWRHHRLDVLWTAPNRRARLDVGDLECTGR
jgi:O-antigen ligase